MQQIEDLRAYLTTLSSDRLHGELAVRMLGLVDEIEAERVRLEKMIFKPCFDWIEIKTSPYVPEDILFAHPNTLDAAMRKGES